MGIFSKIDKFAPKLKKISKILSGDFDKADDEYFRTLAESIPQMVWCATANGVTDYFNKKWFEYFGQVQNFTQDWHWRTYVHPEDLEKTLAIYWKSIYTGTGYESEYRLCDKHGNYRWFLSRGNPIRDRNKKIIRWIGTATDIHEQKEAIRLRDESLQAQLIQQSALEDAIKTRDDFISLASHELKTPLTSLLLQIQLHKKLFQKDPQGLTQERIEKLIKNFDTQVLRLSRTIEHMIDASTFKPTGLKLNHSRFDLAELVKEVCDYFTDVKIHLDLPNHVIGYWDRFRIEQVLHNFLTNAVKYSGNSDIHVQVFKENQWAYISVEDNGPGIHADDHQKIFKPFERATSGKKIGGLGLGLFIVDQIVTAHKGKVQIDSKPGQGAKFTVKLPYSLIEVAHDHTFSEQSL